MAEQHSDERVRMRWKYPEADWDEAQWFQHCLSDAETLAENLQNLPPTRHREVLEHLRGYLIGYYEELNTEHSRAGAEK